MSSAIAIRSRAEKLLAIAQNANGRIDQGKVLEVVRSVLQSQLPGKRQIAREIGRLATQQLHNQTAKVTTATELNAAAKAELSQILQKKYPHATSWEWEVDPALIGGLTVEIGDMWYDASVVNDLTKIKERLTK